MDFVGFYEKTSVRVYCNNNIGSGCLFQPSSNECTYVLTAKHCLTGKPGDETPFVVGDIKVVGSNEQTIKVNDYILHETLDLAIIIIEYINDLPKYFIGDPSLSSNVILNGYPDIASGERKSLKCEVHECSQSRPKFEILIMHGQLSNYSNSENTLMEGFSGSGVFNIESGYPVLVGIFPASTLPEVIYSSLEVIKTEEFNKLLEERGRSKLIPSNLSSFKDYISPAFEARSEKIARLLCRRAEDLEQISPLIIKELLKEKLMLPYGDLNLNEKIIWIGWITLLTYLYIESGKSDLKSLLIRENHEGKKHNVKLFYTNNKRLEDLFKKIIQDRKVYQDLKSEDCIIVNHEGRPGEILKLSKKKMDKIVTDIGVNNLLFEHDIPRIDQHMVTKNISLMHVEYFTDKFREHVDIEDYLELEGNLRSSITEVLNNE